MGLCVEHDRIRQETSYKHAAAYKYSKALLGGKLSFAKSYVQNCPTFWFDVIPFNNAGSLNPTPSF